MRAWSGGGDRGSPCRTAATRRAVWPPHLADSATFAAAMLPLDFTTFTIEAVDEQAVARIVLMGASMVRFRIPPSASYTRLHDDQRAALLATAGALHGWWGQGW